jgi:hypothetical protein
MLVSRYTRLTIVVWGETGGERPSKVWSLCRALRAIGVSPQPVAAVPLMFGLRNEMI